MKKSEVKAILLEHGCKLIKASWFKGKKKDAIKDVLFTAYDSCGICWYFYINFDREWAIREIMSSSAIEVKPFDVSYWFFGKEVKHVSF